MKKAVIRAVKFYQRQISPGLPGCCKYWPTCSSYAIEAVEKYGTVKGAALASWRILRCNPFSKGGFDPVP